MTITARDTGAPQAPAGQHVAVCCDVADLGMVKETFQGHEKTVHKIRVWFQIDQLDKEGKRFLVGRRFTLSLHPRAALRKFLEAWRGKEYTDDEARKGFDVEMMIEANALIQIKTNEKGFTDIDSIMRLPKSMDPITIKDYERWKDRATEGHDDRTPPFEDGNDDDLPF